MSRGKRIPIKQYIQERRKLSTGKWVQKAELECGHIVDVNCGASENHRRYRPTKVAYCIECEVSSASTRKV